MTWEQKLAALKAIADTTLHMRHPGNWCVSASGRSIKDGCMLIGDSGNGSTPQEAVEADWKLIAESGALINVPHPDKSTGYHNVRWNGFMWVSVPKNETAPPERG